MPSVAELWIRRLHMYIGLYFLFFLWLFCLSGIVLNHPKWTFAEFWNERRQTSREVQISRPADTEDLAICRSLLEQTGIRGEISGNINRTAPGVISFRVVRPGDIYDIKADLDSRQARIDQIHVNGWGVMNMLHSFSGVRRGDPTLHQNWWATGIWRFSMDALSVGMVITVLGGIYLWFIQIRKRFWGAVALLLGIATLGLFLVA
ncbi:MAG TPA: PepSY-associated TM helix domain-containing protein [Acidobacteriota bacterium]|nr:PepSY-associated TM helix domain-containing protein [Acidobacteriota bacterium]